MTTTRTSGEMLVVVTHGQLKKATVRVLLPGLKETSMPERQYGPFGVTGGEVSTGVMVQAGDTVRTTSEGIVDFGGAAIGIGAPKLTADGDSWATPSNYPAPSLRKNSLICRVGSSWYPGGVDKAFIPGESGEVFLRTNDASPEDNSGAWTVTLHVTPVGETTQPTPTPAQLSTAQTQLPTGQSPGGGCGCQCGCLYYFVPPWWQTMPPWWVTMNFQPGQAPQWQSHPEPEREHPGTHIPG